MSEPAWEEAFEREQAERMRGRLRVVLGLLIAVWVFAFLFADVRLYGSRTAKLGVRLVELGWASAALAWARKPRSRAALEAVLLSGGTALVALTSWTIRWLPHDQVVFAVVSRLLGLAFAVYALEFRWRGAAWSYTVTFVALVGAYVAREGAAGVRNVAQATMWLLAPAPVLVIAARRREAQARTNFELRRALAATNARLRDEDALRQRLYAHVSHDLRTPLTIVRAEAALLERSATGATRRALERIGASADFAADLCEQLLELSRLEAGRTPHHPAPLRLDLLAAEVCAQLRGVGGASVTCEASPAAAYADAGQVRRIVLNLVSNALKHAGEGPARVVARVGSSARGDVAPGAVWLEVEDAGPGLDPALRASVFKRATLFDAQGASVSGIGLPLAYELARLQRGDLRLCEGSPTRFVLELPAAEVPPEALAPAPHEGAAAPENAADLARVLVVEDSEPVRALLRRVLAERFTVRAVGSLGEARAALRDEPFDAVLCDVMLGDGSGFELLREEREGAAPDRPFVLLSALSSTEERTRGLLEGADDYVTKPFAPDELCTRVARALERTREAREALAAQREELLAELHDGVSAQLARAGLLLSSGEPAQLEAARRAVASALRETRAAFALLDEHDCAPPALAAELRRATSETAEGHGLAVSARCAVEAGPRVPARVAHALRRLTAEGVANAVRHAQARALRLEVVQRDGALRVTLDDDGVGLDPKRAGAGRGLALAEQRASRVGGSLVVSRLEGGGTRFEVQVPLGRSAAHHAPSEPGR